jgi:hypothetical protein
VGGQNLIGVGSILGGSQNDTFVVATTGSLSGTLNGGAGSNTLDLSALGTANFNLGGTASRHRRRLPQHRHADRQQHDVDADRNRHGLHLCDRRQRTAAASTTARRRRHFSGVVNLTGGAGADVFQVGNTGSLIGTIAGGGGVNALDLSARATANFGLASASSGNASGITGGYSAVTTLVGNGSSTLTGTSNASTFTVSGGNSGTVTDLSGTTTFSGVGSLAGGAAGDVFALTNGGSLTAASTAAPASTC